MEFLEVMHVMFDLQEKFPDMQWDVDLHNNMLNVKLPVTESVADAFMDAKMMFAPIDD